MGISKTDRDCVIKNSENLFTKMISLEHLFCCWHQFRRGKKKRKDIQTFERHLEDRIFQLQLNLVNFTYQHGHYHHFYVTDPKQRYISKATVQDRLVHEVVYRILLEIFDPLFIFHSLSSRKGKGTHVGIHLLNKMIRKISANGTKTCYALKMDIHRFFDSVNHAVLKNLIRQKIDDPSVLSVVDQIIDSFQPNQTPLGPTGIPLGNVTSQLFANIYLHELDLFVKHELRERYYLRYCDDFIILSGRKEHLLSLIEVISTFLSQHLHLRLHPKKTTVRKLDQGIDFVGQVLFAHYKLLRTRTKQRMKKRLKKAYDLFLKGKIKAIQMDQKIQSYLGLLSHVNQHQLSQAIKNSYWVRGDNGKISEF